MRVRHRGELLSGAVHALLAVPSDGPGAVHGRGGMAREPLDALLPERVEPVLRREPRLHAVPITDDVRQHSGRKLCVPASSARAVTPTTTKGLNLRSRKKTRQFFAAMGN